MVIHHDKLAYGKLAPEKEDLTERQILEMLQQLNKEEEEEPEKKDDECSKNTK